MSSLDYHLGLLDIVGTGSYKGKDYRDKNGCWVLIYDVEFWEKTGRKATIYPEFAHVDMAKEGWVSEDGDMFRAREHWVTTTEPFKVITPKEEQEKINRRQEEIYRKIVNEFFEWHKADFFSRSKNAPDEKSFQEIELEGWRSYKFSPEVIKGERRFWQVIPECIDEEHPTTKEDRGNNQAKEEGRFKFFKWLERYSLSNEATPPPTSTDTNQEKKTKLTHAQIALLYIYTHKQITRNNVQEIAERYGQTSGQKLISTYNRMVNSSTERTSSKFAVRDIEEVIELLSEVGHLKRAKDELKQAKQLRNID